MSGVGGAFFGFSVICFSLEPKLTLCGRDLSSSSLEEDSLDDSFDFFGPNDMFESLDCFFGWRSDAMSFFK